MPAACLTPSADVVTAEAENLSNVAWRLENLRPKHRVVMNLAIVLSLRIVPHLRPVNVWKSGRESPAEFMGTSTLRCTKSTPLGDPTLPILNIGDDSCGLLTTFRINIVK